MTIAYEYRPGVLYLNLTNRCSNDCSFCARKFSGFQLGRHDLRLSREPDPAEILDRIGHLEGCRSEPFDEVVFCGFGEPTYRLDVILVVGRELRARGRSVRLNTNGQADLINGPVDMEHLAAAVDTVSISLNAPDAETYAALCCSEYGAEAYTSILSFARRCVEYIPNVVLTAVEFSLDPADRERCEVIAAKLGASFRLR